LLQRRQICERRSTTRQQQHRQNRQDFLPHNVHSFTPTRPACKVGFYHLMSRHLFLRIWLT
jgi:hypothetical protein